MNTEKLILLIDDDLDDQEIFGHALSQADKQARCIYSSDGKTAIENLTRDETLQPDFIFIDMNMPRMNGKQCLEGIKKIERLRNVPVYLYSTAPDPGEMNNHLKLGAEDYIVKPSDIRTLIDLLTTILNKKSFAVLFTCLTLLAFSNTAVAQDSMKLDDSTSAVSQLKKLSFEELMNIVVTSATREPKKLTESASAIQVLTNEEIRRSGAIRLPEALRLATNLQVAQSGSHDWALTSRGFNGLPVSNSSLANKLLVMIDGRSVYTPLFGGVFWDVQNTLLEDLEQIEVISGPGGAMWGANAVNGIVNILTKSAKETQGLYATAAAGTFLQDYGAVRYGGQIDSALFFRIYGQRMDYNPSYTDDKKGIDQWNMNQGGFRVDYLPAGKHKLTFQGDLYEGKEDDTASIYVNGQNIMGRWTCAVTDTSSISLQVYYDRTYRNIQRLHFQNELNTFDADFQHNFRLGRFHKIVWGVSYQLASDLTENAANDYKPRQRNLPLTSGFIQDQIRLSRNIELTAGIKVIDNYYTGIEFHPTLRLAFSPKGSNTLWAAVSRGVRTPTRFDRDNYSPILGADREMQSENVIAYETGYRIHTITNLSFAVSLFYNDYSDLRSVDTNTTAPPLFYFANNMEAQSYGVELSANYIATDWWKLRGGYTWQRKEFKITGEKTYPYTFFFEANDPENQFLVQSMMTFRKEFQFDQIVRYTDVIPGGLSPKTPSYFALDLRLSWQREWFTFTVVGQNLLEERHAEFGLNEIPRSVYAKISVRF